MTSVAIGSTSWTWAATNGADANSAAIAIAVRAIVLCLVKTIYQASYATLPITMKPQDVNSLRLVITAATTTALTIAIKVSYCLLQFKYDAKDEQRTTIYSILDVNPTAIGGSTSHS